MAVTAASKPATVNRNRFMIGVLGGIGTIIGVVYVGSILRYLYPSAGSDTPPLAVKLGSDGVTPAGSTLLPWNRGVAGPFYYPTVADKSVVVGMFVAQKDPTGVLTQDNLMAVEQTCTHLGCPVAWIAGDNRFECPCHGSQFNRNLSVYHGPAADPLHQHEFTLSGDTMTILKRK